MYKFLAVGGLILLIVSLTLSVLMIDSYSAKSISLLERTLEINKETQEVGLRLKTLKPEDLQNDSELRKLFSQTLENGNKNDIVIKELDFIGSSMKTKQYMLYFASVVGAVTSVKGFYLWYYRLQRYEDAIVKKRASSL